jgi:archaellum component FlaC
VNPHLKAFFEDKAAQLAWSEFILNELSEEALRRVYKGQDTAAIKEAHDIISKSFKTLGELFTPKKPRKQASRAE